MERLLRALPSHLMACLLGRLPAGGESAAALSATTDLRGKAPEVGWTAHDAAMAVLTVLRDPASRCKGDLLQTHVLLTPWETLRCLGPAAPQAR